MLSTPPILLTTSKRTPRGLVWAATILLIVIGLAAAGRRVHVLLSPTHEPRFAAAAALDAGFSNHAALTFLPIVPAALLFILMPLQFVPGIRARHLSWHRWSGRLMLCWGSSSEHRPW